MATKQKFRTKFIKKKLKGLESLERVFTGLEEITVEEKRPREGRPARNLEAPGAVGFESDGCEVEPSIGA